jgi:RNA polymerase sigma-70 factor, ECF subfamily
LHSVGDEQLEKQFKLLFDSQYERLCRAAARIVQDDDEARDIIQQVMLELWEKRKQWSSIESMEAYLYTAAYHRSLNVHKTLKANRGRSVSIDATPQVYLPADELEIIQLHRTISEGIEKLPTRCKSIFLLSREDGMTYAQIASTLEISVKTVEAQMGIALKRIKAHLESVNVEPGKIILGFF